MRETRVQRRPISAFISGGDVACGGGDVSETSGFKTTVYIKNGAKAHDRRRHNGDVLYFANTIPQTPSRTVETSRTRDAHHFQFSIFN